MKLTYLGTGAGAGVPELFCSCDICQNARNVQGRELRNRSMALINDDLCIDMPCDARSSMLSHKVDPRKLNYFLITHNHYDHFLPDNFINRPAGVQTMELYISAGSGRDFANRCARFREPSAKGLRPVNVPEIHFITAFETVTMGPYKVTALPANHDPAIECLNFILTDGAHSVLWLHDTGIPLPETWQYLKERSIAFDMVSMDCSFARGTCATAEHMDLDQCRELAQKLREIGLLKTNAHICLSHIGHNVNATHQQLAAEAAKCRMEVAYDGLHILL